MLKIKVQSKVNLFEYVNDKNYTLSVVPFFCDRTNEHVFWGLPDVYWRGLNLSLPFKYEIHQEKESDYIYYVFLNVAFDPTGPSTGGKFNLRESPRDVCLQFRGGVVGSGFESNIVKISKNKIVGVLNK